MGAWFQRELLKGFFSYAALTVQFFYAALNDSGLKAQLQGV